MSRIIHALLAFALALLLAGCTVGGLIPSSPPIPTGDPGLTPHPSATPMPATATPRPTATPNPCPSVTALTIPALPEAFGESYILTLRDYLTAGGDPATLAQVLQDWAALAPEGGLPLQRDVTGDGVPEVVIAFINPQAEAFPPEGLLAIFTCRDGIYEMLASYAPGEWTNVALVGGEDLTGNGIADVVFADVTCGAHTCWHTLHIWSWEGSNFQEQVNGSFSLPYPTFTLVNGAVIARSTGVGSVGAGPQRVFTETWTWNGSVITRTAEQLGPAEYRYHAFRDGDDAFRRERYVEAFDAYVRVINDETLEPWAGYYDAPEERLWFTALARWRLLLMGMKLGNTPDAEAQYQHLQSDFNTATPGYAVTRLAQRFWDAYQRLGLLPDACAEVITAPEIPAALDFLNSFGYANPTYAAGELCPLTTP